MKKQFITLTTIVLTLVYLGVANAQNPTVDKLRGLKPKVREGASRSATTPPLKLSDKPEKNDESDKQPGKPSNASEKAETKVKVSDEEIEISGGKKVKYQIEEHSDGELVAVAAFAGCNTCEKQQLALDKKAGDINPTESKPALSQMKELAEAAIKANFKGDADKKVEAKRELTKEDKKRLAQVENCERVREEKNGEVKFLIPTSEEQLECAQNRIDELLSSREEGNVKLAQSIFNKIIKANYIKDMMAGKFSSEEGDDNFSPYVKYMNEILALKKSNNMDKSELYSISAKQNLAIEAQAVGFFKALNNKHEENEKLMAQANQMIAAGDYVNAQSQIDRLKSNSANFNKLITGSTVAINNFSKISQVPGLTVQDFKKDQDTLGMLNAANEIQSLNRFSTDVTQLETSLLRAKTTQGQKTNTASTANKFFKFALDQNSAASGSGTTNTSANGGTSKVESDFNRAYQELLDQHHRGFNNQGQFQGAGLSLKPNTFNNSALSQQGSLITSPNGAFSNDTANSGTSNNNNLVNKLRTRG